MNLSLPMRDKRGIYPSFIIIDVIVFEVISSKNKEEVILLQPILIGQMKAWYCRSKHPQKYICILIQISHKFRPKGPIKYIPA